MFCGSRKNIKGFSRTVYRISIKTSFGTKVCSHSHRVCRSFLLPGEVRLQCLGTNICKCLAGRGLCHRNFHSLRGLLGAALLTFRFVAQTKFISTS
jgi:hypothetical protein